MSRGIGLKDIDKNGLRQIIKNLDKLYGDNYGTEDSIGGDRKLLMAVAVHDRLGLFYESDSLKKHRLMTWRQLSRPLSSKEIADLKKIIRRRV